MDEDAADEIKLTPDEQPSIGIDQQNGNSENAAGSLVSLTEPVTLIGEEPSQLEAVPSNPNEENVEVVSTEVIDEVEQTSENLETELHNQINPADIKDNQSDEKSKNHIESQEVTADNCVDSAKSPSATCHDSSHGSSSTTSMDSDGNSDKQSSNDGSKDDASETESTNEMLDKSGDSASPTQISLTHKSSFIERQEEFRIHQISVETINYGIEESKLQWRKFRKEYTTNKSLLNDRDLIEKRLEDVTGMCSAAYQMGTLLANLAPEVQETVKMLTETKTRNFNAEHRKDWTALDYFRYAARVVKLVHRMWIRNRLELARDDPAGFKYTENDKQLAVSKYKHEMPSNITEKPSNSDSSSSIVTTFQSQLNKDLRNAMILHPRYRTPKDVALILIFIRRLKPFINLFPSDVDREIARIIGYEWYEDGRFISFQNRRPEKLYYILNGRMKSLKSYRISDGYITRFDAYLTRGNTTNHEIIEQHQNYQTHFAASGHVEALVIHKWDYLKLANKIDMNASVKYIEELPIFDEFQCEKMMDNSEVVNIKYYGPDTIVLEDSNDTPWIHIIKTGTVRVVRQQSVFNDDISRLFRARNVMNLGCVKAPSHATAMTGLNHRQREIKIHENLQRSATTLGGVSQMTAANKGRQRLDRESTRGVSGHNKQYFEADEREYNESYPLKLIPPHRCMTIIPMRGEWKKFKKRPLLDNLIGGSQFQKPRQETQTKKHQLPPLKSNQQQQDLDVRKSVSEIPNETSLPEIKPKSNQSNDRSEFTQETRSASMISATMGSKRKSEHFEMSRNETNISFISKDCGLEPTNRKKPERPTCVIIDMLYPSDIFGFHNVKMNTKEDNTSSRSNTDEWGYKIEKHQSLTLISNGAEIIRVSKRFFVNNATNNTMLKVESWAKEYLSENEVKVNIDEQTKWNYYKRILHQRMASIHSSSNSAHQQKSC